MIIPAIDFAFDKSTTTSIQRNRIEWIYSQSNIVTMFEKPIQHFHKNNVTTVLFDGLPITNLDQSFTSTLKTLKADIVLGLEETYDIEIKLPVKKVFKIKAKIKKISKFHPHIFID